MVGDVTFDYEPVDGVFVYRRGVKVGEIWMTARGACYRHSAPFESLSREEVDAVVVKMREMEAV